MALNLSAIGQPIGPLKKKYNWKDAVLYALGVGAGFSDLQYCYEKDLKTLPSFSMALVFDFFFEVATAANVNLAGILHGEQDLTFYHPIPAEGELTTRGTITGIFDKGKDKGALVEGESHTFDSKGKKLFTSTIRIFARLDGGFGGENAPDNPVIIPDQPPDLVVDQTPSPDQPLLYRLSGDVFQLHVDPEFAKMAGFEKPIMHGLCTHGFACRALIQSLIPGQPEKVRRMNCRFSKPLYPGTPIQTRIWKTGDGTALWQTVNAKNGDVVIDKGVFEYGDQIPDQIRLDGKVAIVTGAGSGLGRQYALELARRGACVVVNDLGTARDGSGQASGSPADAVVTEIQSMGGKAVANYDNVATEQGGNRIVQTALDAFGTVDILINNAGILRDKTFAKLSVDNWHAVIDVHLNGAYHVTRPAFQVMKQKGYGRIIMTTSAAGLYGNFGQANYSAAKLALVGLMNSLKQEGAKYNIQVNTVAPLAMSRLTEDIFPPEMRAMVQPELVVPMVVYLCSDQCSVSGNIYNAGAGVFNRAAIVTGKGTIIRKNGKFPTPEDVMAEMDAIIRLDDAVPFDSMNEFLGQVISQAG